MLTCTSHSTGLPLSTYFSAIKIRWMIDHWDAVRKAHDEDDLLFGTVESWIVYVRRVHSVFYILTSIQFPALDRWRTRWCAR